MKLETLQQSGLIVYVSHDVVAEPPLKPLTGENVFPATANRQYDARADIHACGFWGRWQSAFLM